MLFIVEEKTSQPTCPIDQPTCPVDLCECSLDCLARGQKAKVAHVTGPNRCRLLEMGFTSGTEVEIARRAAFGGPLEIRVRSYRLSLRMEEAQAIQVQTESDKAE
jgi:ferrous iron transport protein A